MPLPRLWEAIADIKRGDDSGGTLIQHRNTKLFALWTGTGSIESLPQNKVKAALATLGGCAP